jgi:hypothetical protein
MNKAVCNIEVVYNRASRVQSIFCGMGLPEDTMKNIYALPFTLKTLQEKYFSWQSWANFDDARDICAQWVDRRRSIKWFSPFGHP